MADTDSTARDKATVMQLLRDNESKGISPRDLRDAVESIFGVFGGLYICEGSGSQSIASEAKTTVDQWTNVQAMGTFENSDGDQALTVPVSGVYDIAYHVTYNTDSRYPEFYRVRITRDGAAIPGPCNRATHFGRGTNPAVHFHLAARRFIDLTEGEELELEFESSVLSDTRTIDIKHAGLEARLIG